MFFVDKEALKQLIINIKDTFIEDSDNVVIGKSTNDAEDFINPESTNEEIITAWNNNKFALAKGLGNISIGYDNLALGEKGSFASGISSITEGTCSFVAGENIREKGDHNVVFNANNRVTAQFSSVFGRRNKVDGDTYQGFVIGYQNELNTDGSFSNNTFVGGADCKVTQSHNSIIYGNNLKLFKEDWGRAIFGKFNDPDSDAKFIIGNGEDDLTRSNAFEVYNSGLVRTPNAPTPIDKDHLTTKGYVDTKIATAISTLDKLEKIVVPKLPETGKDNTIYMVEKVDDNDNDYYDEYMWINNDWEILGSTQIDLTDYVKNTDYALNGKAGVFKTTSNGVYGLEVVAAGSAEGMVRLKPATKGNIDNARIWTDQQYYPLVYGNAFEYATMLAMTDPIHQEWTDNQKTAARTLLNAVGKTDYATASKAGLVRAYQAYGTLMNANTGIMSCDNKSYSEYQNGSTAMFISKGTLENIKNAYVKDGITANTIALTDDEKTAAQTWLGINIGDIETALDNIIAIQNELIGGEA